MKNKKNSFPPMVGGSSLLMIFAILCLTVFTLLTLSTVNAGRRLSNISADAVSAYYSADLEAEQIFAQLRLGELPDSVEAEDSVYRYTCAISDTQFLAVELHFENDEWNILRWQTETLNQ